MEKIELKIRQIGDPVLKNGVKTVKQVTDYHRQLLSEMARLMYEVSGVGLAAPQVGIAESLIVVDAGTGLYKLINPKITEQEGHDIMEEGCLSVPGIGVKVTRSKKVRLEAQDETGKVVVIEAEDLLARVFQHELDHLNGKLIVDHAPPEEQEKINRKLNNLKQI